MIEHTTMIEIAKEGYLGRCTVCQMRDVEYRSSKSTAQEWCDQHTQVARTGRLNVGTRPSTKTLERLYRENSENLVYTPTERAQWLQLADGLAERLAATDKHQVIEGQMSLFESPGE